MGLSGKVAIVFSACAAGTACGIAAAHLYLQHLEAQNPAARNPEVESILEAIRFSASKHRDQQRQNRTCEPLVNHFLRVAKILTDHGVNDTSVLQAGILLGVVTYADTPLSDVREKFGLKVAGILEELSEDDKVPGHIRPQKMLARANRLSREARLVLLAHKLDVLKDILEATPSGWDSLRVENYSKWAEQVVVSMDGTHAGLEKELATVFRLMQKKILLATEKTNKVEDSTPAVAA